MSFFPKKNIESFTRTNAEQKHLNIRDHAALGISEIDSSGKFLNVNRKFCQLTGYLEEELLKMKFFDLCEENGDNELKNQPEEMLRAGKEYFETDLRMLSKDNNFIWLRCFFHLIKEDDSPRSHTQIIAFDITPMKIEVEDRQKSEENFRLLAEVTFEGIVLHIQGVVFEVNDSFCRITGYSREECIGANLLDYVAKGESLQKVKENLSKNQAEPYTIDAIRKDGSIFMAELEARNINYKGETIRIVAVRDVSSKYEAERKFQLLAENSVACIWQMTPRLKFTYLSPSIYAITGFHPEEWIGTNLWEHSSRKEFIMMARSALKAIKNFRTFNHIAFETKLFNKKKELIPVEIIGRVLIREGRLVGLQGSTKSIIERKKQEEELHRYRKNLELLVKERTVELEKKNEELLSYNKLFVGREFRIKELRDKVKLLEEKIAKLSAE
jgi:PAS domain S-box-containing protein